MSNNDNIYVFRFAAGVDVIGEYLTAASITMMVPFARPLHVRRPRMLVYRPANPNVVNINFERVTRIPAAVGEEVPDALVFNTDQVVTMFRPNKNVLTAYQKAVSGIMLADTLPTTGAH